MISLLLLSAPATWFLYNLYCLLINYRRASRLGVPTICVLISPDNPLWIALQTSFSSFFRHIPLDYLSFTKYSRCGWEFHDRYQTHQRLGEAWILVTPNRNWLYVSQAEAANDILRRSHEFVHPCWMTEPLNVFGPSISTAEGPNWQRQRKLTATPFNEQKSSLIWTEAIRQASDMLQIWLSRSPTGFKSTSDDVRTLALHVLAYAGFQKSYPYNSVTKDSDVERPSTYRDSLSVILKNVLVIMVLPAKTFTLPFLPKKWTQIGWAIQEFKQYMLDQIADEKALIAEGKPGSGTLVSNLVRAGEELPETTKASVKAVSGKPQVLKALTVDEILGNIFVFNFAGHDTTAISTAYAMLLLVAQPEVQDWISEELNFYIPDEKCEAWTYDTNFPKLKRTLAVLLETLRLYNPLPGIPKYTGSNQCALVVNNKTINIPSDTLVVPNLQALHTYPRYWGTDSLTWRPSRWILPDSTFQTAEGTVPTQLPNEKLLMPEKGTFIPWSEGARNCPGKKFAQVEFVATMATLFRNYRVQPVVNQGETLDGARKRVLDVVKGSSVQLLLQMRDSGSVAVTWSRR